ncbi:MAG: protein kinase [Planctomycetes bacterium]|nr:protein kinase [Planctomycetota bacterium]
MTADSRLAGLFAAALPLAARERARFLQASCADEQLRQLVEELLTSHDRSPAFLEQALSGAPVPDLAVGPAPKQLGPYRVLDRLGNGAMGVVYRAEQEQPRREVALKVLTAGGLLGDDRRRFRREAELLGRLQHPGIGQVFEAGVEDSEFGSVAWFAMELVRGQRLDEAIRPIAGDVRAVCELVARIADAVQHAHERGVVHRDLKPANILVLDEGGTLRPKVLDFGIARSLDADRGGTAAMRTMTGQLFGTLPYMSPEQVRGTVVGPAADIYALGVIAFELLAGRLPLPVDNLPFGEAMRRICDDEPPPLRRVCAGVDADVETIVAVAMHKDAERRYPSAAAFAQDLRRFVDHEPIVARSPSAVYRLRKLVRRHRGLAVGIGATFLVLVVATVVVNLLVVHNVALASDERLARQALDRRGRELRFENYRLEMALAIAATRSAFGSTRLDALLAKWEPQPGAEDLRDFEWYLLRSFGAERRMLPTPGDVYTLRWHPWQPWLLVGGRGFAQVLDREHGTVRADLGLSGHVFALRWSPDGRHVAAAVGSQLTIFDIDAPQQAKTIALVAGTPPQTERVTLQSVTWLGDSGRLVGISHQGQTWSVDRLFGVATAFRRDLASGFEPDRQPHTDRVALPDGIVDGRELNLLHAHDGFTAETSRWDRAGNQLAITIRGRVAILDAAGQVRARHEQPQDVVATTWSPDGTQLATMANTGMVHVLDARTWHVDRALPSTHSGEGMTIDWSPDGRWLATGRRSADVALLDLGVPAPIRTVQPSLGRLQFFSGVQWHPRERALAVQLTQHSLICDPDTGAVVGTVPGGWMLSWSPDGTQQAWYEGHDVVVRRADGSLLRQTFTPEERKTSALMSWTADGNALLIRVRDQLWFWPFGSPAHRLTFARPGAIACAPHGDLACVTTDGEISLLDPLHDRIVTTCKVQGLPWAVFWSHDGTRLATLGEGAAVALRDGKTLALQRNLGGGEGQPAGAAWHPDGKRIATTSRGGVHLWDPDTGALAADLADRLEPTQLAFSPDGQELAVMMHKGEVVVYDARVGRRRAIERR